MANVLLEDFSDQLHEDMRIRAIQSKTTVKEMYEKAAKQFLKNK